MVRSWCSGDEQLDSAEHGVWEVVAVCTFPYCWLVQTLVQTLDHGVVHDFGESAHENRQLARSRLMSTNAAA